MTGIPRIFCAFIQRLYLSEGRSCRVQNEFGGAGECNQGGVENCSQPRSTFRHASSADRHMRLATNRKSTSYHITYRPTSIARLLHDQQGMNPTYSFQKALDAEIFNTTRFVRTNTALKFSLGGGRWLACADLSNFRLKPHWVFQERTRPDSYPLTLFSCSQTAASHDEVQRLGVGAVGAHPEGWLKFVAFGRVTGGLFSESFSIRTTPHFFSTICFCKQGGLGSSITREQCRR